MSINHSEQLAISLVAAGFVAPANAARAQMLVVFTRAGMASGESHYVGFAFAQTAAVTNYIES